MSDFGVWESVETSDSEKKIASQKSQDKLAAAIYDVKDKYGDFLYASTALDEFHDRVALVKTDMMKTVDQHLMPVTGVMRRVIKACKDEWRNREAVHPHAPARGAEPLVSGHELGWSGDPDDEYLQHLYEEGLSGYTPEEAKFLTYKDLMEEPPPGYARGDVAPYDERLSRRRQAGRLDTLQSIVQNHQAQKVDGMLVDAQTANLLLQLHGKGNDKTKSVIETAPLDRVAEMAWGLTKSGNRRQAGDSVRMKNIPECDICKYENGKSGVPAAYDGKTQYGPWANMCEDHFKSHGVGLGTGKGQRFTSTRRRADYTGPNISTWGSSDEAIGSGSGVASVQGIPGQAGVEADGVIGKSSRRRRADNTGPAMVLEETFTPSSGNLVPEGNFDGYLAEVEQGAPEKAGENFIEGGRRRAYYEGYPEGWEGLSSDQEGPRRFNMQPTIDEKHPQIASDGYLYGWDNVSDQYLKYSPSGGLMSRPLEPGQQYEVLPPRKKRSSVDFDVYKDYCETNGLRVASIDSLDHYAENLSDAQYFRLASIIQRIATQPLPGGDKADPGSTGTVSGPSNSYNYGGSAPGWGGAMEQGGVADWQPGTGAFQQNMIAPGQIAASRRRAAGSGKTNYLQKADEALTQVLESKAEEFQETIAPLQQALQVIQQAEQAEQAANPMGVQPPPGTVNVLPGQDPSMGGGDPSMGGGDPSMGGDPMAGGGGDLAQALGLAGAQGMPTPGPEGAQQQITGRQRKIARPKNYREVEEEVGPDGFVTRGGYSAWDCENCGKEVARYRGQGDVSCPHCDAQYNAFGQRLRDDWRDNMSNYDDEIGDMEGYEDAMAAREFEGGRRQARADDIAGYTYDTQNFEPGDLIEYMIAKGELSPGARGMNIEDVLDQHAGGLGIDRHDERSYDSSEHPKVIFESQLDPEYDSDWYSGFREGSRQGGGAYPFVREGGILDQYNSWLKKRKDLPRGGEADYWAFARENGFGQGEVDSLKKHFQTTAAKVSLSDGEMGSYPRTSGVRGQRSGASPVGGSNRSSSTRESNPSRQGASAGGRKARLSNRNTGNPRASDDSLSGGSGVSWSQTGEARGTASQRSGSRQSSGEPGVWDQGSEHAGHGRSRHAVVPEENSMSRRASAGRAESSGFPVEAGLEVMQGVSGRTQMGQASSWDGGSDRSRSVLSENNVRKLAWSGFGFGPSSFQPKVAGWIWDSHLNGYIANAANKFACSCGESFDVPSYHNCKCGKIYNSYVIGTGGDNHTASIEKYICREIQVRPDVVVANRKAKRHRVTDPGALGDGEEDDLPTMKPVPQDWRRRNEHGQFSAKRR